MVILTGENLGKRQQDLNKQVHKVATCKDDFEKIKIQTNSADLDVLFKIGLASKYKNVDYILNMLKSGDSLYISRALKCTWLYDDEYSNVINVDFLHHNIFPSMSVKMKRKCLTTISMYLVNEERAEIFYTYCTSVKLRNIALKFLINTSESFKIRIIERDFNIIDEKGELFYKNFVGNSFTLATTIMEKASNYHRRILYYLRYLISVDENNYLDILEKYDSTNNALKRFGLRISTNILKKHRSRVLEHPLLYVTRLNKNSITTYINLEDAKRIIVQILPAECERFWGLNFCETYNFLFKKIPAGEKYQFVKNIFNEKYPNEEFEMSRRFLNLNYQVFMTIGEREAWALRHIETKTEMQGVGRDYRWYQYVNFEKAFLEIKKVIVTTPDLNDRHDVVQVLIKSVRNLSDMKSLLTYYYDRHVNEAQHYKEHFLTEIIKHHNVFEFDNDSWTALNKLLHSIKVYKTSDTCRCTLIIHMAVLYHIVHNIALPKVLKEYILEHDMHYSWNTRILSEKLSVEQLELVYQYIVKVYLDKITALSNVEHQDDKKVKAYVQRYVHFLEKHHKFSDSCPDLIMEFVKTHWDDFRHLSLFSKRDRTLTQAELMCHLKKDAKFVVEKLPEIKNEISAGRYPPFRINSLLKKLKVYFPNDITKEYLKFFMETLTKKADMSSASICTLVYAIFQLADDQTKIEFMEQYAPTEAKIKHGEIDEQILGIQEGICKSVCFSRPPVPLSNVLKYITGDYVRYCLPMFQSYQAKLPEPLLVEFVNKLIDSPVSIQKHALRLIFQCFSIENAKKTIYVSWKKTKNISLRYILYQSLFKKIREEDENIQVELFEALKKFTAELKDDDNVDLYNTYMRDINILPEKLRDEYITTCWQTVSKFSDKTSNYDIKRTVLDNITSNIELLDGNFVKEIVEDYVSYMLINKNIRPYYISRDLENFYKANWKLVVTYIIYFSSDINFLHKNMDIVRLIINKCLELWHEINDDIFTYRKFCRQFIDNLIDISTTKCCADAIPIFETILNVLKDSDSLSLAEYYREFWSLNLTILRRKVKQSLKVNYYNARNPDLLALVKVAVYDYGTQVGYLVKENVDLKSYCISMNDTIGEMIKDNVGYLTNVDFENIDYECLKDIEILGAEGLTQVPSVETCLLAIYILPKDSDRAGYTKILNDLKQFECVEVQTCLYNKFVYSDFKRRKLD